MSEGQKGVVPVPEGETWNPDYSNPWLYLENRAVVIAGIIFCTICLALRLYTRATLLNQFCWDDGESGAGCFFIPLYSVLTNCSVNNRCLGISHLPNQGIVHQTNARL